MAKNHRTMQMQKKKMVNMNTASREIISKKEFEKDKLAWEKLGKSMFSGPKTDCVKEIDLVQ